MRLDSVWQFQKSNAKFARGLYGLWYPQLKLKVIAIHSYLLRQFYGDLLSIRGPRLSIDGRCMDFSRKALQHEISKYVE